MPVLVAPRSPVDASLDITVEALPPAASRLMTGGRNLAQLGEQPGRTVDEVKVDADGAWRTVRRLLADPGAYAGYVRAYTTTSAPTFREQPDGDLVAVPRSSNRTSRSSTALDPRPRMARHRADRVPDPRHPRVARRPPARVRRRQPGLGRDLRPRPGRPRRLRHRAAAVGLQHRADPRRRRRHPRPARRWPGARLHRPRVAGVGAPGRDHDAATQLRKLTGTFYGSPTRARPISAVRVRVEGVTGVDELSRERVRLVAQRIETETGLAVDVTVGASYVEKTLVQPATDNGQPRLRLYQSWVKLGVATTILRARPQVAGALRLVLLVSGLSITNAALASVRSRRTHLGVLACLGWTRRWIARGADRDGDRRRRRGGRVRPPGAAAGRGVDVPVSRARAGLAVAVAVAVTLVAALVPALLAGGASPLDALHPPGARTGARAAGAASLASGRCCGALRSLLAVAGLAVATAVTTLLLAVAVGFQGAVAGTVLGDVVAVQARDADYGPRRPSCSWPARHRRSHLPQPAGPRRRDRHAARTRLERGPAAAAAAGGRALGVTGGVVGAGAGYARSAAPRRHPPWQAAGRRRRRGARGPRRRARRHRRPAGLLRAVPTLEVLTDE